MGKKIRTFCSSTLGVVKIAGVWRRSPLRLAFFFQKNNSF